MAPKALFEHCVRVYERMDSQATDGIYEGYLTKLFEELGLAVPYYSQVMSELKRMGSVEQVKRGGGSAMSIWALVSPPDEEAFKTLPELTRNALGGRKVQVIFDQRIRDLEQRVSSLEEATGVA